MCAEKTTPIMQNINEYKINAMQPQIKHQIHAY